MPAKKSMSELLNTRGPSALRQPINPVDIIEAAGQTTEREERTSQQEQKPTGEREEQRRSDKTSEKNDANPPSDKSIETSDERVRDENPVVRSKTKKRSSPSNQKNERNTRTKKPRLYSERDIQALLATDKRETVRYSFEAFADQKEDIQRVCDLYEESTGKHLSASRLLRELLDSFLPGAIKAFENSER